MISTEQLREAAAILRAGGLVAFPTETVYGLGANALDAAAVRKIFAAKGRPSTSPLIVHVHSTEMARELVAADWSDTAQQLAERFWPGPLTLVVPKRPAIPDEVTAGLPTVGVRMPAHPVALALIREAGVPLAAPSANRFTQLSPTTAGHVRKSLGAAVDLVLDGGACQVGIESTVLSLAGPVPVLLRPGMLTREELEAVAGPILIPSADGAIAADAPHPAPGMHLRHYSPRTPLMLISDPGIAGPRDAWLWQASDAAEAGARRKLASDPAGYARELYHALHDLDMGGWDRILVEMPPNEPQWFAIRDRLRRAASQ